ncbi:MAG: amidase [Actinomycetota bacterium]
METAAEMARAVRDGRASPVELAEEAIRRAERWQPVTDAFSHLHPEDALEEAGRRADEVAVGGELGPLHGVPVAVKDLFDVAGWETTGCCRAYVGTVALADADAVRRLRAAGAVIVGKTNQHELAAGGTNLVSACGPTRNPWDPGRMTGGSSGGSGAAVAARVVPLALGTDTGGSVRIPASFCGTVGLKPTHGRVSLRGVMPLAPSMDTVGPLCATAGDAALALEVLTGEPVAMPPPQSLSVGLVGRFVAPVRADVGRAAADGARVLGEAGVPVREIEEGPAYDPEDWERLAWPELFEAHGHLLERPQDLGGPTRRFLEYGRDLDPAERAAAGTRAAALRRAFLDLLAEVDALLVPATLFPAPGIERAEMEVDGRPVDVLRGAVSLLTRLANMAGIPAVAFPAGFSEEGLPLGLQLLGRPGEEGALLSLVTAFQAATDHHLGAPAGP